MYKLVKHFTSRDGKLEPDNRKYGIDQEGVDLLGDAKSHLGGATHIFVKTIGGPSDRVRFFTRDGQHNFVREEKNHGWAEYELNKDSGYSPDKGQVGWWGVQIEDAPSEIVDGLGLPDGQHVSNFLVFEWDDGETGEIPETPEENGPEIPDPENPSDEERSVWIEIDVMGETYSGWLPLKKQ